MEELRQHIENLGQKIALGGGNHQGAAAQIQNGLESMPEIGKIDYLRQLAFRAEELYDRYCDFY